MVSVVHSTSAAGTNRGDSDVSVNAWNAEHTITGLGTAAEANTADLITKAEGAANSGFTLIKYKRSEANTYARTGAALKAIGADDSDGISLLHWLDPAIDDELLAGTNAVALDTPISNSLVDFASLRATSGRAQKMTIPSVELLINGGINFNVDGLVVFGKGARIRSTKATSGYVVRFEGDNTEIHGLKIYSEGALDNLYSEVVGQNVKLLNGYEFEKLAGQSGTTMYVRDNADGLRMHNSGVRGGNGINCFNASDLEWMNAWIIVESVGGDDGIAFKADTREVFDNRLLFTYFENAAAMLSIGTGVGMPAANDPSYSRGVYRTKMIGCYGKNCARMAYLKPAGADGTIGDSRDFRDGTVADTEISSNTLEDPTGAKFSSGVELAVSRGARVFNTHGKNNVIVARAKDSFGIGGAASLAIQHFGVGGNMDGTAPAKIDGFSVGIKYEDPQGGVANGVGGATGYPVDGAVRVRLIDTAYGSMDNIDLGGIEAENINGNMIRVYSGLNGAVRIPKLKGRNINVGAFGTAYGINTDSTVHVGSDIDVEMSTGSVFGGTGSFTPILPTRLPADTLIGNTTASTADATTIPIGASAASDILDRAAGDGRYSLTTHNHDATYQPLDADLTAIAALTTDAFGRGLLERTSVRNLAVNLGIGYVVDQGAVAASHTGTTSLTTVKTVTIPAGVIGANGSVVIEATFGGNDTTDNKTYRVNFGGTFIYSGTQTTSPSGSIRKVVHNRNSESSQVCASSARESTGFGTSNTTLSVDTTAAVDVTFQVQLGVGTDTATLESWRVVVYPKD